MRESEHRQCASLCSSGICMVVVPQYPFGPWEPQVTESTRTRNEKAKLSSSLSPMARPFVRDVALLVVVEFIRLSKIRRRIFVAEAALFRALGLRRRARRILIRVERESLHVKLQVPRSRIQVPSQN